MRSVTYSMGVSLDGYIAGPDGDFGWTPGLAETITDRHFDAYLWVLNNLRLPILSLGLKEVSGYLGFGPPPM